MYSRKEAAGKEVPEGLPVKQTAEKVERLGRMCRKPLNFLGLESG